MKSMNKEEREMVAELLNWISESGEATGSTRPMLNKAANIFGLYEIDKVWVLRPADSCAWHDPFYGT
jgi:hypothetical protein